MNTLPSGSVTLLFADGEDSTQQGQQYPDEMFAHLTLHNEILDPSSDIISL
jgi:hypothetical protein